MTVDAVYRALYRAHTRANVAKLGPFFVVPVVKTWPRLIAADEYFFMKATTVEELLSKESIPVGSLTLPLLPSLITESSWRYYKLMLPDFSEASLWDSRVALIAFSKGFQLKWS